MVMVWKSYMILLLFCYTISFREVGEFESANKKKRIQANEGPNVQEK